MQGWRALGAGVISCFWRRTGKTRESCMKIDKIESFLIGSDLVASNYVLRITTDSGLTGTGQSGAWGYPDAVAAVVDQFRDYLIGADPFHIDYF